MTDTLVRPSRRSFVRAAAWTVPVVSIAAAAPAYALTTAATLVAGTADKWGKDAYERWHVSWDLQLTKSTVDIDSVTITVTYAPSMKDRGFDTVDVLGFTPLDAGWVVTGTTANAVTGEYTVTATHDANILAGNAVNIHFDFAGLNSNSAGDIWARGTVTYVGGGTSPLSALPQSWSPRPEHSH